MSDATPLPDCMMPDGGEACVAYREAVASIQRLTRERDEARAMIDRSVAHSIDLDRAKWMERAKAAEAREAKLREALETISARDGWFDGDSVRVARAALATKGETMPVYQNDGRVTTDATVPSATRCDPIAEAVERGIDAWIATASLPTFSRRNTVEAVLAAALAPYGGLEAIRKLEAAAVSEAEYADAMAIIKATWSKDPT